MPYIDEHRQSLQTLYLSRSQAWLDKKHKEEFVNWLRRRLLGIKLGNQLDALSKGPSSTYLKYQGYEINEFTFYTKKQDRKSTYQNRGVHFDAHDENGNVHATYYGFIEEIWELAYGPFKAALFAAGGSGSRKSTLTAKGSLSLISLRPHTEMTPSSLQKTLCKSSMQGTTRQKQS